MEPTRIALPFSLWIFLVLLSSKKKNNSNRQCNGNTPKLKINLPLATLGVYLVITLFYARSRFQSLNSNPMSKIELESSLTLRGRISFTETKIGVRAMVRARVRARVRAMVRARVRVRVRVRVSVQPNSNP